jgi:hypothetical protein
MTLKYRDRGESRSGTICDVMSGTLVICRIWKQVLLIDAKGAEQWNWTFQVSAKPEGFRVHGSGEGLDEAKALVERQWQGLARCGRAKRTVI